MHTRREECSRKVQIAFAAPGDPARIRVTQIARRFRPEAGWLRDGCLELRVKVGPSLYTVSRAQASELAPSGSRALAFATRGRGKAQLRPRRRPQGLLLRAA